MKNRQLLKIHGLAAVCSLIMMLASCSSEEIVPSGTGTDADGEKNLTTFVAVGPEQTRTSMDYTGGDAPFYWEEGDKIYVKDDDGAWKVSNAVDAAHAHSASFKFKVSGKFNNSSTYKVFYPGKNGTNDQVTIPATQTQTAPNTTLHFGEAGDCGMADATGGGGYFQFTLDHQAAILVFQPYDANTKLNDCYLTKIEVTSDDNITGTYTIAPSTGDLTGAGSGKQIDITTMGSGTYANGFPIKATTASLADNGTYVLIKPGTHTLKVRYWIKDYATNVEGTITKQLSSFTYNKNTYYDMTANLDIKNYKPVYCLWDAKKPFWKGHEWDASNIADRWQPTLCFHTAPSTYTYPTDPQLLENGTWPGLGIRNDAVNLCKDCPNANEMAWYCQEGDPRWIDDDLWTCTGHLRKGGMWLKKKARIASDHGKTTTDLANAAPDGTDWRSNTTTTSISNSSISHIPPSASEMDDYLYLPALGFYNGSDGRFIIYYNTIFWSSSSSAENLKTAYTMEISNSGINVHSNTTREHNVLNTWKFE